MFIGNYVGNMMFVRNSDSNIVSECERDGAFYSLAKLAQTG